jgi:hypothetical protein
VYHVFSHAFDAWKKSEICIPSSALRSLLILVLHHHGERVDLESQNDKAEIEQGYVVVMVLFYILLPEIFGNPQHFYSSQRAQRWSAKPYPRMLSYMMENAIGTQECGYGIAKLIS